MIWYFLGVDKCVWGKGGGGVIGDATWDLGIVKSRGSLLPSYPCAAGDIVDAVYGVPLILAFPPQHLTTGGATS